MISILIILVSIFTVIIYCDTNGKFEKSSVDEYFKMPALYKFDDYLQCFDSSGYYCVVNSFIKPDNISSLYNQIKDFSSFKKIHLRHDKLQRGICINKCEMNVLETGNSSEKYFVSDFPMDAKVRLLLCLSKTILDSLNNVSVDFRFYSLSKCGKKSIII